MKKDDEVVLLRGYYGSVGFLENVRREMAADGKGEGAPGYEKVRTAELVLKILMLRLRTAEARVTELEMHMMDQPVGVGTAMQEEVREELRRGLDF